MLARRPQGGRRRRSGRSHCPPGVAALHGCTPLQNALRVSKGNPGEDGRGAREGLLCMLKSAAKRSEGRTDSLYVFETSVLLLPPATGSGSCIKSDALP